MAHLSDRPDDWPSCKGDQKVGIRIAMIGSPHQDPLTWDGHVGTLNTRTHTHTHTHTQEEGENRYEVVCSIYNHTVVLPVKHQGKSTLSYVHMLSLSLVRLFCDPMDWSPPGPPFHGIYQIRTLEWFAISFSKGSSWPWDQTSVSCIDRRVLYQ